MDARYTKSLTNSAIWLWDTFGNIHSCIVIVARGNLSPVFTYLLTLNTYLLLLIENWSHSNVMHTEIVT